MMKKDDDDDPNGNTDVDGNYRVVYGYLYVNSRVVVVIFSS